MIGTKLAHYEITAHLGTGGMGEVYQAIDSKLGRSVAIKLLPQAFAHDADRVARFEREARVLASLNHPNIAAIYGVEESGGRKFLVMELVGGETLRERIQRGPIPIDEALPIAKQIAEGLESAHEKRIAHRDLKPANIKVTPQGQVKLLDFGLAKAFAAEATGVNLSSAPTIGMAATNADMILGTAAYMSPEQARGERLDERTDIFSYGVVLYELLSGKCPFTGNSTVELLSAVLRDEAPPLNAPEELAAIVRRCLAKRAQDRFASMVELKNALHRTTAKPSAQGEPSIAVLPFANMSGDKENEYFSDGLAEEILNLLARIPGLKVTARTSSFSFRGKEQDIRKIAEALGVRTILEGSVRRAGNRIRVTAQLIDAAGGYHLWSERYDRNLADVFTMQDEIAMAIVGALRLKLAIDAPRHYTPKLPAYEAFLRGRHHFLKYTAEALARSQQYYEHAAALDATYGDPHLALAASYLHLAVEGVRPAREVMPLVRKEAAKALDLDPSEPRAHALLAAVAALYDYQWDAAAEGFRLALANGSGLPGVRQCHASFFLVPSGRFQEAVEEIERELKQDPLNVAYRAFQAHHLQWAGLYARGIEEARAALEIENHWLAHYVMAENYACRGMLAEALASAESARELAPWNARVGGVLAAILARTGDTDRSAELRMQLKNAAPIGMVVYHLLCSELDAAADWYEKIVEQREPFAVMYAHTAIVAPLRSSARWLSLAKTMNLPIDNLS